MSYQLLTPPIEFPEGSSADAGTAQKKNYPTFEALFSEMLAAYTPVTIDYQPVSAEVLRSELQNWLRPSYDLAIRRRKEETDAQRAGIDADAWARGMGTSTYVSDVKQRAMSDETQDIAALESSYGSTLAEHLFAALQKQEERRLETDRFNADAWNDAKSRALSAAMSLYQAAGRGSGGSGGGSSGGSADKGSGTVSARPSVLNSLLKNPDASENDSGVQYSYDEIVYYLDHLPELKRSNILSGRGTQSNGLRSEIVNSIGKREYQRLLKRYGLD